MPYIFCPKCGGQMEIQDITDSQEQQRKELYCTKCDFRKIYGT
jgi:DNA-directed RNA polymerase subunit RPC12/RpoP